MNRFEPFRECLLGSRRAPARQAPLTSRLPSFIGFRGDAEGILRRLRVVLVGVGSVGMRIAEHFARLRVAELWLVDPGHCSKPESVLTHPISRPMTLPKATYIARLCKRISPETRVFAYVGLVQDLGPDAFADAHLCVMATDNLAAEIEFGRRCLALGKRLVHAALHGESLTIQVRVYTNTDGRGPCPACAFGAAERQQLANQVHYSCEAGPSAHSTLRVTSPPTRSTSNLCALAADLGLNQAMRLVLGLGEPVGDTIMEYCGFTNRILTSSLARNPACRCDHTRYEVVPAPLPIRGYSFARLVDEFMPPHGDANLTVTVGGAEWIECGLCRCAEPAAVRRFISKGRGTAGRCPRCQTVIHAQPLNSHEAVTAAMLGEAVTVPLSMLGVRKSPWALLRRAETATLIRDPRRVLPLP
jgi:molybdopterin/thiamine biosynthesis adenylyltransferase